jgi:hypothetical protein
MKNALNIVFTFLNLILFGQNNMNEQLDKLFLDLDLTLTPQAMVAKSPLKFEYGITQTISWGKTDNNSGNYVADFDKNSLINSKIKKGLITIIPENKDLNTFSINERIWFHNYEDMLIEYNNLCSSFEKIGNRVKNSIIENENFEKKSETTEILMKADSKKATLTIGYFLPPKGEKNKEFFLAIIYSNR